MNKIRVSLLMTLTVLFYAVIMGFLIGKLFELACDFVLLYIK